MVDTYKVHTLEGDTPPSEVPTELFQHYVDRVNKKVYFSIGTTSVADWKEIVVDFESTYFSKTGSQVAKGETENDVRTIIKLDQISNIPSELPNDPTKKVMQIGAPAILDSERRMVENASGGKKTVIDGSIVYVIPRNTYDNLGLTADLGTGTLTAFDKGYGAYASEIFIGAYQTSRNSSGKLVSQPGKIPLTNTSHDSIKTELLAQGNGCHLWTMHERAAVVLECKRNSYEPNGNTEYGRSFSNNSLTGRFATSAPIPGDIISGFTYTLTGSGPKEWNHDGTANGIADLVGNVWDDIDGFKLINGRFYINPDNNYTLHDSLWVAQNVYFNWTGTVIQLANTIDVAPTSETVRGMQPSWMAAITKKAGYTSNQLVKRILMEPVASTVSGGSLTLTIGGERTLAVGGTWGGLANSGLSASYFKARSLSGIAVGSRLAYIF